VKLFWPELFIPSQDISSPGVLGRARALTQRVAALRDSLFCALLSLLVYITIFGFDGVPYGDLTADDRLFIDDAMRMLHGQTLYRDFFNLNFPGAFVFYYWVMRIVGIHTWIAPVTALLIAIILIWLTLSLSRCLLPGYYAWLPTLSYLALGFTRGLDATHHWFSVSLVLGAALVIVRGMSRKRMIIVGALCGTAAWFTQTRGTLAVVAFALYLWWDYRQKTRTKQETRSLLLWLVASFGLTLFLLCAYHLVVAGPRQFFIDTVWFNLTCYGKWETVNSPDLYGTDLGLDQRTLGGLLHLLEKLTIYLLVPGMYLVAYVRSRRSGSSMPHTGNSGQARMLRLALILGPVLVLTVMNSAISGRFIYDSYFAFLLFTWYCTQTRAGKVMAYGLAAFSLAVLLTVFRPRPKDELMLPSGRVAFFFDSGFASWLKANTKPGDYVFEAAWGNYYYEFQLNNPTPVPYLTNSGFTRPSDVQAAIAGLERHKVKYILKESDLDSPEGKFEVDYLHDLRVYMAANYRLIRSFDTEMQVWQRIDSR
jgi:hypothetical protein